jgi:hypothetical protein
MEFPGLPAAKTVEQAILLAQLQILRQMETMRTASSPTFVAGLEGCT